MSGPEAKRSVRVGERLRVELSELLMRGRVRDPRAIGVIISDVRVTGDLSLARVYVRVLGDADQARRADVVAAMNSAAGFLRREIGPGLRLRRTPELSFMWDDLVDSSTRMEEILHELASERHTRASDPGEENS